MRTPVKPRDARRRLAENLRIIRLLRDLSQEELADLVGMDRSYVGGIERGERNISLDNLERIARALDLPITELLNEPDRQAVTDGVLEAVRRRATRIRERTVAYRIRLRACRGPSRLRRDEARQSATAFSAASGLASSPA